MGPRGLRTGVTALVASVAAGALVAADPRVHAQPAATPYQQDLDALCAFASDHYAYWERRDGEPSRQRWQAACAALRPTAGSVPDLAGFLHLLESLLAELADPHAFVTSSHARSPRLVPTDADLWLAWQGRGPQARAVVRAVRADSAADRAGVRAGQHVVAIGGLAPSVAAAAFEPRSAGEPPDLGRDLALTQAAAGRQDGQAVMLTLVDGPGDGPARTVAVRPGVDRPPRPLTAQVLTTANGRRVGWIRLHNSLGDPALVPAWDAAVDGMAGTAGLVLDLRDTPSGGDTTVARSVMGRLVDRAAPYQQHELASEWRLHGVRRVWVEWLMPRGRPYVAPVVVLVGPWTGSMGEGTAIGLHAARAAAVFGPPMAGLLGGLGTVTLANSRLQVKLPTEVLRHVDGTPREDFRPCRVPDLAAFVRDGRATARGEDGSVVRDPAVLQAVTRLDGRPLGVRAGGRDVDAACPSPAVARPAAS